METIVHPTIQTNVSNVIKTTANAKPECVHSMTAVFHLTRIAWMLSKQEDVHSPVIEKSFRLDYPRKVYGMISKFPY
ncbi:hypothetical protein HOLleu_34219 [Holothuria leucospilota]|uniref:Uncharacterized protein n=1 Tax=Holothuria leucospilota TaxID=206669 RepID=A0A9Q0YPX4_HOLLE|nr:hypothetical protein HOLleu_34219 [Holothuria leucospilota]